VTRRTNASSPDAPIDEEHVGGRPRHQKGGAGSRRWVVIVGAALVTAIAATTLRFYVFPVSGTPAHADAIVVLNGYGYQSRIEAAYRLAHAGVASAVVISTTASYADRCATPSAGVTLTCFVPHPASTQGEAREIALLAARHGWRSLLVVAGRSQETRARVRVGRCFDGRVALIGVSPPTALWPYEIAYEWAATAKALILQRSC
jgi:hypothetical protein